MSNWIIETETFDGNIPVVKPIGDDVPLGEQRCHCCFVYSTRREAKVHELTILRMWQMRVNAELLDCENRIVTVMRELNLTNNTDNRRV